jgi:DNA processing protein
VTPFSSADVRDLLALHLVPGLGPRLTAALLEHFGTADAVRRASAAQLQEVRYIGESLAAKLAASLKSIDVDAELVKMARHGVSLVVLKSPGYPAALTNIPNPPHLIYCRGTIDARDAKAVAIVGSRRCTAYGKRVAERLAADLARAG